MNIDFNKLKGHHVELIPMEQSHAKALYEAGKYKEIWAHMPKSIHSYSEMEALVKEALQAKAAGVEFPFVIVSRDSGEVIGSTRFLGITWAHKGLEIGWTWLNPSVWRTAVNTECKYLLMKHCFEDLGAIRIQYRTDNLNVRSQNAIERIGGIKEGVLRNHRIRENGTFRHSVVYSVTNEDWPKSKAKLEAALSR